VFATVDERRNTQFVAYNKSRQCKPIPLDDESKTPATAFDLG